MGTRPDNDEAAGSASASRFAYHTDSEPEEGGVRATGRSASGAPGPAERLLDISELARNLGMRYTHRFHIPPYPEEDIEYAAPLDGEITLTNTGALLLLRGQVQTTLRLACGRCLTPFEEGVTADLEEEFDLVTSRNAFHQEEVQAVDEDTPASVIEGNVLNRAELLRQNLLLAAPLQPLCREDCPGLVVPGQEVVGEAETAAPAPDSPLRRLGELWTKNGRETAGEEDPS